jgi:hypothetical protein
VKKKTVAFCRTIDSFIVGYAKQALSIFLVDLDLIMDVVSFEINAASNQIYRNVTNHDAICIMHGDRFPGTWW